MAAELERVRCFAGLSVEEAGGALGMSRTTAYRHWNFARAWRFSELRGEAADPNLKNSTFSWDKSGPGIALLDK
jgi:hypothetical protein